MAWRSYAEIPRDWFPRHGNPDVAAIICGKRKWWFLAAGRYSCEVNFLTAVTLAVSMPAR